MKQGNEASLKDGTLLDISKDMKSDILEKLAEAIYVHSPYPAREEYDLVAQALINKHSCRREPGSACGWYYWKFSLRFKMGNFRQKHRVAGCPDVKINSRLSGEYGKKTLKRAKKSEVNFLPDLPLGKTPHALDKEITEMAAEMMKKKVDWKKIEAMMFTTFSLRRKEIVEEEPPVVDIKAKCPALFSERQVMYLLK